MEKKTLMNLDPSTIEKRNPDPDPGVIFNGTKLVVKIDNFKYC